LRNDDFSRIRWRLKRLLGAAATVCVVSDEVHLTIRCRFMKRRDLDDIFGTMAAGRSARAPRRQHR